MQIWTKKSHAVFFLNFKQYAIVQDLKVFDPIHRNLQDFVVPCLRQGLRAHFDYLIATPRVLRTNAHSLALPVFYITKSTL